MPSPIKVATANTYYGNLLTDPNHLKPFSDRDVDVLLLQETHTHSLERSNDSLKRSGYEVLHSNEASGLIIAAQLSKELVVTERYSYQLTRKSSQALAQTSITQRFRERSLIGACLQYPSGEQYTVFTSHPVVFIRMRARTKQMGSIITILANNHTDDMPIIFGGDLNHYPSPQKIDRQLESRLGFKQLEIKQPTWEISGSKHEWLARLGSIALRRSIREFDAQLDSMWFRNVMATNVEVVWIASDHHAIVGSFTK